MKPLKKRRFTWKICASTKIECLAPKINLTQQKASFTKSEKKTKTFHFPNKESKLQEKKPTTKMIEW